MGLGKTLQVASFTDIFLRYTTAKKVLCIVPINTIQNWQAEFNMWLPPKPGLITDSNGTVVETSDSSTVRYRDFEVYLLGDNHKTTMARAKVIGKLILLQSALSKLNTIRTNIICLFLRVVWLTVQWLKKGT